MKRDADDSPHTAAAKAEATLHICELMLKEAAEDWVSLHDPADPCGPGRNGFLLLAKRAYAAAAVREADDDTQVRSTPMTPIATDAAS